MPMTRREWLIRTAGTTMVAAVGSGAKVYAKVEPLRDTEISVTAADAFVGEDALLARIPVRLSVPAPHTIVVDYATGNASPGGGVGYRSATPHIDFIPARGQLIFQPGEQNKLVDIPLLRAVDNPQSIALQIADFGYPLRNYPGKDRPIAVQAGGPPQPTPANDAIPLPALPAGGSVVFSDDLLDPGFASDSGFRPDGKPCWQSRFKNKRVQDGNRESGYYADPAINPETKVWGIEPATGRRFIQAEYHPEGLSDGNGGKLRPGWRADIPFAYSAALITSRTLFDRITIGSYVEFNVRLTKVAGSWPALWLLPANGGWPPEIDVIEAFIASADYRADVVTSSIHWRGEDPHRSYGAAFPLTKVDPGADIFARFNRFGCWITESQIIYYFNDKPYCAMPNLVGPGPWYMLMDVAVGGLVGEPRDPSLFPAPMQIAGVKVVQFS